MNKQIVDISNSFGNTPFNAFLKIDLFFLVKNTFKFMGCLIHYHLLLGHDTFFGNLM